MKKYKTKGTYNGEIEVVEVTKETEKSVWVICHRIGGEDQPERRNKVTDYECYDDSWGEARKRLVNKANREIESAEQNLSYKRNGLEKIEMLSLRESDETK